MLSFSLFIYLTLLDHLAEFKAHESVQACGSVMGGLAAAHDKLLKFFNKSMAESEYYYIATCKLMLH